MSRRCPTTRLTLAALLVASATLAASAASAQTQTADDAAKSDSIWGNEQFRVDLGAVFSFYTTAVEVGTSGETNDRLATDSSFGLHAAGSWRFWGPLSLGIFVQFEAGSRELSVFTGVDDDGVATVGDTRGGSFSEVWIGPLLRAQWKALFVELGWGAFGLRSDDGRDDLPAQGGDTDGAFRTEPGIAWLVGVGAAVELVEQLELILRLNYRIRYYTTRGGEDLADDLAHGTQDLQPFIGLAWRFDR